MSLHVTPTVAINMNKSAQASLIILEAVVTPKQPTFGWAARNKALALLRRNLSGFQGFTENSALLVSSSDDVRRLLENYRNGTCKLSEVRTSVKRMAHFSSLYGASCKDVIYAVSLEEDARLHEAIRVLGLLPLIETSWYG